MPRNPTLSDDDLLRRMRSGDEDAFTSIYRNYQSAVYRFAMQMCGSTAVAEEVTQEVFMLLMRDSKQFDSSRGSLAAYLYGVARNFVLRALERERPYASSVDDSDEVESASTSTDVLGDITKAERVEALRQAILSLPSLYREAIVLCELHELDYEEAAAVLQCPIGTIRSRLHRARTLLTWKMRAAEKCSV